MQQQPPQQEMDGGRSATLAYTARALERTAEWIGRWYPALAHTRDILVQIGKFSPDEEVRGPCPVGLTRFATVCRGLGSGAEKVAFIVEGAKGLCAVVGAGVRCLNHSQGVGAGLDQAGEPEVIFVKTIPQLESVIHKWENDGDPIQLDVETDCSLDFAIRVEDYLKRKGEAAIELIQDGRNYKTKLSQHAKITSWMQKHPLPKGVTDALDASTATRPDETAA